MWSGMKEGGPLAEQDVLWQSFANAGRAGIEIDALMLALRDILADGGLGTLRIDVDSEYEANLETDQGWTVGYSLYGYKLIPARGRSANRGWVTFGVSLWREEDERGTGWDGAQISKLYVAYWPPKGDGWTTDNLVVDGTGQSIDTERHTAWRWRGVGPGCLPEAWFFCVRLLALQSRADLDREISTPLRLLLEQQSDERAFAQSISVLNTPAIT